jgi:hypothetical protein
MKNLFSFIWRGALGGALIQLLLSIVIFAIDPSLQRLATMALFLLAPASVGAAIGAILWLLGKTTLHCHLLNRMAIGSAVATALIAALLCWFQASPHGRVHQELILVSVFFGLEIGLPAATLARKPEDIQRLGLLSSFSLRQQKESIVR